MFQCAHLVTMIFLKGLEGSIRTKLFLVIQDGRLHNVIAFSNYTLRFCSYLSPKLHQQALKTYRRCGLRQKTSDTRYDLADW